MSFNEVRTPAQMEALIQEVVSGKKQLRDKVLSNKLGIEVQDEQINKFQAPVVTGLKKQTEASQEQINEAVKALRTSITAASAATQNSLAQVVAEITGTTAAVNQNGVDIQGLLKQLITLSDDQIYELRALFAGNKDALKLIEQAVSAIGAVGPAPGGNPPPPQLTPLQQDINEFTQRINPTNLIQADYTLFDVFKNKADQSVFNTKYDVQITGEVTTWNKLTVEMLPINSGNEFVYRFSNGTNEWILRPTLGLISLFFDSSNGYAGIQAITPGDAIFYYDMLIQSGSAASKSSNKVKAVLPLIRQYSAVLKAGSPTFNEKEFETLGATEMAKKYGYGYAKLFPDTYFIKTNLPVGGPPAPNVPPPPDPYVPDINNPPPIPLIGRPPPPPKKVKKVLALPPPIDTIKTAAEIELEKERQKALDEIEALRIAAEKAAADAEKARLAQEKAEKKAAKKARQAAKKSPQKPPGGPPPGTPPGPTGTGTIKTEYLKDPLVHSLGDKSPSNPLLLSFGKDGPIRNMGPTNMPVCQKNRNPYKFINYGNGFGKFGNVFLNIAKLNRHPPKLIVYDDKGTKLINQQMKINRANDLMELISKRHNPKKEYSGGSIEDFKKIVSLSGFEPSKLSGKWAILNSKAKKTVDKGTSIVNNVKTNIDNYYQRLEVLTGMIRNGNNNPELFNEAYDINKMLFKKGLYDKDQYDMINVGLMKAAKL